MKQVHRITVNCFMYPSEDEERVKKALSLITGKLPVKKEELNSYYGPELFLLSCEAGKQAQVKQVLENIELSMSEEDMQQFYDSIDERLDDEGVVHMRFDKQQAYDGKLVLGYSGDIIKVQIRVAAYPFSREKALEAAKSLFE